MKRSRAEPATSKAAEPGSKAPRRCRDAGPPAAARSRRDSGAEKRPGAAVKTEPSPPTAATQEEGALVWDGVGELGGWWLGAVEAEMLLGWFPFVDEDFLCSENRGGCGLVWEEEDYHDIWQLQRIHEVPNSAK